MNELAELHAHLAALQFKANAAYSSQEWSALAHLSAEISDVAGAIEAASPPTNK